MTDNPSSLQEQQAPSAPHKTRGDVLFDRWVYGGLNGVGTFLLTLPLAFWGDHGGGKETFQKFTRFLTEKTPLGEETAKTVVRATTLGLGGTVMVVPVRIIEGMRTPIVNALNQRYGSAEDKAVGAQEVAPQTWGSLLKGRLVAWVVVFSSFKAIEAAGFGKKMKQFEEAFSEKLFCNPFKKALHTLPQAEVEALKALGTKDALKTLAEAETTRFRYGKLAALDVFATTAATILLYVGSRFFAKHRAPEVQEKLLARQQHTNKNPFAAASEEPQTAAAPETSISGDKQRAGKVSPEAPVLQAGV